MSARQAAAGLVLLLLAACGSPQSRIKRNKEQFAAYPLEIQARIKAGEVDVGFTAEMVRMALGDPARKTMRTTAQSVQEVWTYGETSVRPGLGVAIGGGGFGGFGGVSVGSEASSRDSAMVVFEGGKVVSIEKVKR